MHVFVSVNFEINFLKNRFYNEHYPSVLVTFFGETEHFSGKNGALRWGISVGKQKHNVQKPSVAVVSSGQHTRYHPSKGRLIFGRIS